MNGIRDPGLAWQRTLFALFAVSGFCGLIYESIWAHYLKLFVGHAAYAQTVVIVVDNTSPRVIACARVAQTSEKSAHRASAPMCVELQVLARMNVTLTIAPWSLRRPLIDQAAHGVTTSSAAPAFRPGGSERVPLPSRCQR